MSLNIKVVKTDQIIYHQWKPAVWKTVIGGSDESGGNYPGVKASW